MASPRTVTTLEGKTFVLLNPVALADILRGPTGPVMRHIIVVGEAVKTEAIRLAPVRTGNLRDHIVKRVVQFPQGPGVVVGIENVQYAIWVHEGSVEHDIYPRNASVLAWPGTPRSGNGNMIFAKHVHHPGNKPNRFLVRALRVAGL